MLVYSAAEQLQTAYHSDDKGMSNKVLSNPSHCKASLGECDRWCSASTSLYIIRKLILTPMIGIAFTDVHHSEHTQQLVTHNKISRDKIRLSNFLILQARLHFSPNAPPPKVDSAWSAYWRFPMYCAAPNSNTSNSTMPVIVNALVLQRRGVCATALVTSTGVSVLTTEWLLSIFDIRGGSSH